MAMTRTDADRPWPIELRYKRSARTLTVAFDDGATFEIGAELLRVESPSAEVKGHGPGQKQLVLGKENIAIAAMEPVGNYAVRLVFDDGHDTGLYSWDYLYALGRDRDRIWRAYDARRAAAQ